MSAGVKNKQIKRIKTEAGEIIFKVHVKQKPERGLIKQVVLEIISHCFDLSLTKLVIGWIIKLLIKNNKNQWK